LANAVINTGGDELVWTIKGFLKTVMRDAATPFTINNTYRLTKAVDLDFDLSPAFEIRFNDDGTFDVVPNGDVGTWSVQLPLTSNIVSTTLGKSITTDDDKNTLTYWVHELINKRFPPIEFDDEMVDNQSSPEQINFRFKGFMTGLRKVRTETEGVFNLELSGIMRPDTVAEIAADQVTEIINT